MNFGKSSQVSFIVLLGLISSFSACSKSQSLGGSPAPITEASAGTANAATASAAALPSDPNVFVNLSKKVVRSVVNISTTSKVKSPLGQGAPDDPFRRFFEEFFGQQMPEGPGGPGGGGGGGGRRAPREAPRAVSLGTGFIIEPGLIMTNNHVVADADEIKITFTEESSEKPSDGEVVGRDPDLDIALIKVKSKREMVPLPFGDSDALEVGEYVMAVGNPFGHGHSVTHGIISAKSRQLPNFPLGTYLQTDTSINPGNSGGPLVNLRGEVIGVNNAIDARAQGIGFAIPSNAVKSILAQLKSKGSVERGYIGVLVGELTPELAEKLGVSADLRAPFVTNVTKGGPADAAGIQPYDVITSVNGKQINSSTDLIASVTAVNPGQSAKITVNRAGKTHEFKVKVARRPGAEEEAKKPKKGDSAPNRMDVGMDLDTLTSDLARRMGLPANTTGAVVANVEYGGPADRAGLARGDVIVEVDRKPVRDADGFYAVVKDKKSYLLRVLRADPDGNEVFAVVILDLKK